MTDVAEQGSPAVGGQGQRRRSQELPGTPGSGVKREIEARGEGVDGHVRTPGADEFESGVPANSPEKQGTAEVAARGPVSEASSRGEKSPDRESSSNGGLNSSYGTADEDAGTDAGCSATSSPPRQEAAGGEVYDHAALQTSIASCPSSSSSPSRTASASASSSAAAKVASPAKPCLHSPAKSLHKDGYEDVIDGLHQSKVGMESLLQEREKQVAELSMELESMRIQGRTSLEAALDRESAQRDRISSLEARVKELEEERVELRRSLDKKTKMHESTLELMHEMQVGHNETSKAQIARVQKLEAEIDPLREEALEAATLKAQNGELTEALEYMEGLEEGARKKAERVREEMAAEETQKALQEVAMLEGMLRKERKKGVLSDQVFQSLQARTAELGAMERVFRLQESLLEELEAHVDDTGMRLMREAGRQLRIYNRSKFDSRGRPLAEWVGPAETDNPLRPHPSLPMTPAKSNPSTASFSAQESERASKRSRKDEEDEDKFEHPRIVLDPALWSALSGGERPPAQAPLSAKKKPKPKRMIEPKRAVTVTSLTIVDQQDQGSRCASTQMSPDKSAILEAKSATHRSPAAAASSSSFSALAATLSTSASAGARSPSSSSTTSSASAASNILERARMLVFEERSSASPSPSNGAHSMHRSSPSRIPPAPSSVGKGEAGTQPKTPRAPVAKVTRPKDKAPTSRGGRVVEGGGVVGVLGVAARRAAAATTAVTPRRGSAPIGSAAVKASPRMPLATSRGAAGPST